MATRSKKPGGSPYKVLIWMGVAIALLFAGIVAYVMLRPSPPPRTVRDPERTLLWLYDDANPKAPASAAVLEESRSRGTLAAVTFPAPEEAQGLTGSKLQQFFQGKLQRQLHHRVALPYSVVATLIDAAGGISLDGGSIRGADALAYIRAGGGDGSARATAVLFALSQAVTQNGINIGVSQGLSLARQVDTDLDLTALPDVIGRWSSYGTPAVRTVPRGDLAAVAAQLQPDPPAPAVK